MRLVDVQADPEDDGVVRNLGEDAPDLAAVDQHVVGPLDLGGQPQGVLDRVRGRKAADERDLGDVPPRGRREQYRGEDGRPGWGRPAAAEPPSPARLHVAHGDGALAETAVEELLG